MLSASLSSITFGCPHCGSELIVAADAGTREGPCPTCGQHIRTENIGQLLRGSGSDGNQGLRRCFERDLGVEPEPLGQLSPVMRTEHPAREHAEDRPSSYDVIVKKLAEYEAAGIPVNHPDRLHLVEELFRAASLPDFEVPPPTPSSEARAMFSHLPPPRGKVPPCPREAKWTAARDRSLGEVERTIQPVASSNRMQSVRPTRMPGGERHLAASERLGVKAPPMTAVRLLKRPRRENVRPLKMNRVPDRRFSGLEKTGLVVIGFILIVGAVFLRNNVNGEREFREPESISEARHMERKTPASLPPLTKAEQARLKETVKRFHRAGTAEAKAPFLLDGIKMLERLASYYQTHSLEPREIAIDQAVTMVDTPHGRYYQGTGRYADGRVVTFFAKKEDGDFLLDWPIGD